MLSAGNTVPEIFSILHSSRKTFENPTTDLNKNVSLVKAPMPIFKVSRDTFFTPLENYLWREVNI